MLRRQPQRLDALPAAGRTEGSLQVGRLRRHSADVEEGGGAGGAEGRREGLELVAGRAEVGDAGEGRHTGLREVAAGVAEGRPKRVGGGGRETGGDEGGRVEMNSLCCVVVPRASFSGCG